MGLFTSSKLIIERRKDGLYAKKKNKSQKITIEDLVNDLSDKDMSVDFHETGWGKIIDENSNLVYEITDYKFNKLEDLNKKGAVVFPVDGLKPKDFKR